MRYTSPDEARSDLFLSAAFFLFAPLIVNLLLNLVPLRRIPGVAIALEFTLPLVYTVLVPFLLIRYRKESVSDYRGGAGQRSVALGLLLALPIVVSAAPAVLLRPQIVGALGTGGGVFATVARALSWLGLAALAWYCTTKAQDAFRIDPKTLREGTLETGRILAIVLGVATLLLLASGSGQSLLVLVLLPLGIAAALWLAVERLRGPNSTSRAVLLTPTVLFALSAFSLSGDAQAFVLSLHAAAVAAAIGLLIGVIHESRHSVHAALLVALAVAVVTLVRDFGVSAL